MQIKLGEAPRLQGFKAFDSTDIPMMFKILDAVVLAVSEGVTDSYPIDTVPLQGDPLMTTCPRFLHF